MDNKLTRIEDKIDKLSHDVLEVKLGYMEHERRSLANEEAVQVLKRQFTPMHELLLQVKFVHRVCVWLGAIVAFVYTVLEIRSKL